MLTLKAGQYLSISLRKGGSKWFIFFNWILQLFLLLHIVRISIYFHLCIYKSIYIYICHVTYKYIIYLLSLYCLYMFHLEMPPENLRPFPQSPVSELHQLLMAVSNGDRIKSGGLEPGSWWVKPLKLRLVKQKNWWNLIPGNNCYSSFLLAGSVSVSVDTLRKKWSDFTPERGDCPCFWCAGDGTVMQPCIFFAMLRCRG